MINMFSLLLTAHQFLAERDWLQYHNPKNDAFNIYVEVAELAEHFIAHDQAVDSEIRSEVGKEMGDVLFAILGFASIDTCDISKAIGALIHNQHLADADVSYEQLREIIVHQRDALGLHSVSAPRQLVLALVAESGKLTDMFLWCSVEDSKARAVKQKQRVEIYIARIFAYLVLLADSLTLDLIKEYELKMEQNAQKYPARPVPIEQYTALKDERYAQEEKDRIK